MAGGTIVTEQLTPQEWFSHVQGTHDAILRVLGEILARHPDNDVLVTSVLTLLEPLDDPQGRRTAAQTHQRLGQEDGIQSVLAYMRAAQARAAAGQADTGKKH